MIRSGKERTSCTDLLLQRVYQIVAGYEDCNDASELRKDPALRLALDKNNAYAASQSLLSRFENKILGNQQGLHTLDGLIIALVIPFYGFRVNISKNSTYSSNT